ncbi:S-layer homology domain-containing protein [Candidatus Formimonas warabiya]|uniref:SLH domain-containing protein n=1 Tax=Formimonas warabiya TaxID=1761012 RepID=A0A3G1KPP1_FORW1|nr:S-layer homology domain-containing protein [Candidatus Formimonas warabiya]ATW24406.1 hypothetical protein DCMF_06070 [Candidatus Formimonas warabiya]
MTRLKKRLVRLMLILALVLFHGGMARAAGDGGVDLTVSNATAKSGDDVEIKVSIGANSGLNTAALILEYDDSLLSYVSHEKGKILDGLCQVGIGTRGEIRLGYSSSGKITQAGDIITVTFKTKEGITEKTTTDITLNVAQLCTLSDSYPHEPVPLGYEASKGMVSINPKSGDSGGGNGGSSGGSSQATTASVKINALWGTQNLGESKTVTLPGTGISVKFFDNFAAGMEGISNADNFEVILTAVDGGVEVSFKLNGASYEWSNPQSPMMLIFDHSGEADKNSDYYVIGDQTTGAILPFSSFSPATGKIEARITRGGSFGIIYHEVSFTDTAQAWMDEAVKFMASRDVIKGTGNSLFSPKANITRSDYVLMTMRLFGFDVDTGDPEYYAKAWALAAEMGLLENIGAGDGLISRDEMFVIMARLMVEFGMLQADGAGDALVKFTDSARVPEYAKELINSLVAEGYVMGADGRLFPDSNATRAEAAQFLYNMMRKVLGK